MEVSKVENLSWNQKQAAALWLTLVIHFLSWFGPKEEEEEE